MSIVVVAVQLHKIAWSILVHFLAASSTWFGMGSASGFPSFSMKSILALYFLEHLHLSENESTESVHLFIVACFATPLLEHSLVTVNGYVWSLSKIFPLFSPFSFSVCIFSLYCQVYVCVGLATSGLSLPVTYPFVTHTHSALIDV